MVPSSYVRVAAEGTTDEKIFFILVTILKERKREKKRDLLSYILKSTCNRRRHVTCADERGGSYRRQYERMKKKILYKSAGTRYWTGACGYVIQVAIFWRCAVMLVLHRQGNVLLDILKYTEEEEEEKNRRDRAPCDRWPYGFVVAIILTFFFPSSVALMVDVKVFGYPPPPMSPKNHTTSCSSRFHDESDAATKFFFIRFFLETF